MRGILTARKLQENKTMIRESCDLRFFNSTELFLDCVSVLLPGLVDVSDGESVVIQMPLF